MSSLLCGEISFSRSLEMRAIEAIGAAIVRHALDEGFGVQLGCAIVQPVVFEILRRSRIPNDTDLPFLLTDSFLWDTSERVIDKYAPDYPDAEPDGTLDERLLRLQRFFERTVTLDPIRQVSAIFTSGYGEDFERETIPASRFAESARRRYEGPVDVPSFALVMTR